MVVAEIAALVGVFIYGKKTQQRELTGKRDALLTPPAKQEKN
jgi:hypothetical protein